jgi:hypothetical protein
VVCYFVVKRGYWEGGSVRGGRMEECRQAVAARACIVNHGTWVQCRMVKENRRAVAGMWEKESLGFLREVGRCPWLDGVEHA